MLFNVLLRVTTNVFVGKRERRGHLEDLVIGGSVIIEWVLGK